MLRRSIVRRSRLFVIPVIVGAALLTASCSALLPGGTDDATEDLEKPAVTLAHVDWAHAHFAAWLPHTHGNFYGSDGEYTDQVVKLSANYEDARVGLVVPSYTNIDSPANLDAAAAQFGREIQGIDPGAGLPTSARDAIDNDVYGLGDWTLIEGSEAEMTTALGQAYDNQDYIVVTQTPCYPTRRTSSRSG